MGADGMKYANHSYPGKPHIGKHPEVLVLPELIEYNIIRPYQKEYISGILHAPFKACILGDMIRNLEFTGCFHGFYDTPMFSQICCYTLCQRCLSCTRGSGYQQTTFVTHYPVFNDLSLIETLKVHISDRPDRCYFHPIRKRPSCNRDSH
ncbi:MAG: hypothetical protein BWX92_03542 [Deltaproteobacteria bacterium ADurb.Bin135]|nr:MAG: hypothetical protein BWX92_03542 [Deltaproteobacteria bacterium ADurb.Bin135]